MAAHGSRPLHRDAPGIQPGEARLRASKAMRAGVSTKKKSSGKFNPQISQM